MWWWMNEVNKSNRYDIYNIFLLIDLGENDNWHGMEVVFISMAK